MGILQIVIEKNLIEYIAKIVVNTRENAFLYLGASPRASIAILNAAKGFAALNGRDFVIPEDIKEVIYDIFGNTVKTQQKTCKKCEDKIEFGLDFEGNTNVSPQLYYKINLLALSENEYTQTSGRLIFWK